MGGLLTPNRLRAVERIGVGLYVLVAAVLLGREIADKAVGVVSPAHSPAAAATVPPSVQPSAATAITAAPSVVVTAAPTGGPQPTSDPLVVTPYENGARRFAALAVPVGYTLTSPISGTVSVIVYQFLGGDVRVGSNIPGEPFFPYITITSADRRVTLRPGALNQDVQLMVKDGQAIAAGSPVFRIAGDGASSWRTFYDRNVTAQVIASVATWPSGAELDPVPLFKR
jgi:hypothetical protein